MDTKITKFTFISSIDGKKHACSLAVWNSIGPTFCQDKITQRRIITALIREGTKILGSGVAVKDPGDDTNTEIGSKIAVKRAIEAATNSELFFMLRFHYSLATDKIQILINSERKAIYSAYRFAARAQKLDADIDYLKRWLVDEEPEGEILEEAKRVMATYTRRELPDWVEILANGNPNSLDAVIEIARADIQADEVGDAS